ncbi:hypothetical protein L9F63_027826 [Diploptera punctata]|nr:hypothetical protein L9F63_027826 [Diploptera punctata]
MAEVTPPWLDVKMLELWLRKPVQQCVKKDAFNKGDNHMGDLHRILVKTKDEDISLIVKCRTEEGPTAEIQNESNMFRKEQELYKTTLPKMDQLLRNALSSEFQSLAPKCYYSCKCFLVLEDLSVMGYKMDDRQKGLDLEKCLSLIQTLARFHASSIKLHELEPKSMQEFSKHVFSETNSEKKWNNWFKAMMKLFIDELESWPEEQWSYYLKKIRKLEPNLLRRVEETIRTYDSDFNVLIHGDLWVNNILYRGDTCRLVDFQFVKFTSFAIDLHLFLTSSVKMEVRLQHTDNLIQEYHRTLCKTMTALRCERKLPTLQELYEEYHRKAM